MSHFSSRSNRRAKTWLSSSLIGMGLMPTNCSLMQEWRPGSYTVVYWTAETMSGTLGVVLGAEPKAVAYTSVQPAWW